MDALQTELVQKKELVVLNLYRLEVRDKDISNAERDVGFQQGFAAALDLRVKELTDRSAALHTSIQEKRIFAREIQELSSMSRECARKRVPLEHTLKNSQKKQAEVQEVLSESLTSFLGVGQRLLDNKQAGQAAGIVSDSWKDHELIRLTQRIKELEMAQSGTRPKSV